MIITLLLQLTVCSINKTRGPENLDNDHVINRCSALMEDEAFLEDWSANQKDDDDVCKLLKRVALKISQILKVINQADYVDLKNLIFDTEMDSFEHISYPYYETFLVINSIKRLVRLNKASRSIDEYNDGLIRITYLDLFFDINKLSTYYLQDFKRYENDFCKQIISFEFRFIYELISSITRSKKERLFERIMTSKLSLRIPKRFYSFIMILTSVYLSFI